MKIKYVSLPIIRMLKRGIMDLNNDAVNIWKKNKDLFYKMNL